MQRLDIQHHSLKQVEAYLDKAQEIVGVRDFTEAERLVLLPVVMNLLAAKAVQLVQPQPVHMPAMAIPGNRRGH